MIGPLAVRTLLKKFGARDYTIVILGAATVYVIFMWYQTSVDLKKTKLVYMNPETKTVEKIVYKEGPVRIVTKIKEVPGKQIETIIIEERAPVSFESLTSSSSTIVPLAVAMTPPRTDRYLLTLGVNSFGTGLDGKALFVGYGFKNRFDVQVGGIEKDGSSAWVIGTLRF